MPASLPPLCEVQRAVVAHEGGPLLVLGGPGTGTTSALLARVLGLVERGVAPEAILVLTPGPTAAGALRERLEAAIERPYEELRVLGVAELGARLLREAAPAAGLDPFVEPVGPGDRLAMLLERIDELTLRRHDLRGNPAALLRGVVERIDRLKAQEVSAGAFARWAAALPDSDDAARSLAAREREFAGIFNAHERMLREAGALDGGDVLNRALALLGDAPHVRARLGERFAHILVDDAPDLPHAALRLVLALAAGHRRLAAFGDDDAAVTRFRGAATRNVDDLRAAHPDLRELRLERSHRCPEAVLRAAEAVVAPVTTRLPKVTRGRPGGHVAFWRCATERAQAQAVAADVEALLAHSGVAPEQVGILVRSLRGEGAVLAAALEERAIPHRLVGASGLFHRAEVRDVLAWLRLLVAPDDATAAVRALSRPPVALRGSDLARCIQIARRRKLDLVSALRAATETPQLGPEARERLELFLELHASAAAALDTARPDAFVHGLVERLGLRRQSLFSASVEVAERLANLARVAELAAGYARRSPHASAREFARYLTAVAEAGLPEEEAAAEASGPAVDVMEMAAAAGRGFAHVYVLGLHAARIPGARGERVEPIPDALLAERLPPDTRALHVEAMRRLTHLAMTRAGERLVLAYPQRSGVGAAQPPSPFAEEARAALGGEWVEREEELFGPTEGLHSTLRILRDDVLDTVARVGGRLREPRLDTDLDVSHAVVRYLELLKLSALASRPPEQSVAEALPEVNARLLAAATPEQREILETSALDEYLLDAERDERGRARRAGRGPWWLPAAREEPSLEPFLPKRGDGRLALSASDIETYRTCPLKYKFARVFRIPQEPTVNQRFGILVHQVLERFHASEGSGSLAELLGLLEAGWRRGGFGDSEEERQLRVKAIEALSRYHARLGEEPVAPVWFEKAFSFDLGGHVIRGRVDRVDRLPDGGHELIDYKTGRPRSAAQLADDVQLALYAVGAREAWRLGATQQSYYYVLDDQKVPVTRDEADREWIAETVREVGEGILGQGFEPTPSYAACSICDFRSVCPATER